MLYAVFLLFIFGWGNMHPSARAPCVGLRIGLPMGQFTRWTICRSDLPTKTLPRRPHPFLSEIDGWTRFRVEIGESPRRP